MKLGWRKERHLEASFVARVVGNVRSKFERTLVTDLIISIAVSSDRPTRDENV